MTIWLQSFDRFSIKYCVTFSDAILFQIGITMNENQSQTVLEDSDAKERLKTLPASMRDFKKGRREKGKFNDAEKD